MLLLYSLALPTKLPFYLPHPVFSFQCHCLEREHDVEIRIQILALPLKSRTPRSGVSLSSSVKGAENSVYPVRLR